MAVADPGTDGVTLGGDLGHLARVFDIPVAVQVVAVDVEANAAARYSVRIAKRKDFPDDGLPAAARLRIVTQQGTHSALAGPGTARLPAMLTEHQPDGRLVLLQLAALQRSRGP